MKKVIISYVVLSYKNFPITLQCINHLQKITKNYQYSIIVVDNNSLNKKEIVKLEKLSIDLIILDENKGYAKANNIGVDYAREKYNPDFICVLNNDVYILDPFFVKQIIESYDKYNFDVMGPQITSPTGESINPFPVISGNSQIKKEIRKSKELVLIYSSSVLTLGLKLYTLIKSLLFPSISRENGSKIELNVPLHGCLLVFSKKYFLSYDEAFDPRTFLFHEEELLYDRITKKNLTSLYNPEIIIYHNEGASMHLLSKNYRKSKKFKEKERIRSLKILQGCDK